MTTTINASPTNGLVQTADGSGIVKLQSNGVATNALAWVNFNGTGTVAIRSSYNVSSITDNGTGLYTVNFATALSDANYCPVLTTTALTSSSDTRYNFVINGNSSGATTKTTSALQVICGQTNTATLVDLAELSVIIFGN
jgi:hypothetical protein